MLPLQFLLGKEKKGPSTPLSAQKTHWRCRAVRAEGPKEGSAGTAELRGTISESAVVLLMFCWYQRPSRARTSCNAQHDLRICCGSHLEISYGWYRGRNKGENQEFQEGKIKPDLLDNVWIHVAIGYNQIGEKMTSLRFI